MFRRFCFRFFIIFIFLISASQGFSKPHYHGQRIHDHGLPSQGIGHEHNGGAIGSVSASSLWDNAIPNDVDLNSCARVELTPPSGSYQFSNVGVYVYNNCKRYVYISFAACSNEHIFSHGGGVENLYKYSTRQDALIANDEYTKKAGGGFSFKKGKSYTFHSKVSWEPLKNSVECPSSNEPSEEQSESQRITREKEDITNFLNKSSVNSYDRSNDSYQTKKASESSMKGLLSGVVAVTEAYVAHKSKSLQKDESKHSNGKCTKWVVNTELGGPTAPSHLCQKYK